MPVELDCSVQYVPQLASGSERLLKYLLITQLYEIFLVQLDVLLIHVYNDVIIPIAIMKSCLMDQFQVSQDRGGKK